MRNATLSYALMLSLIVACGQSKQDDTQDINTSLSEVADYPVGTGINLSIFRSPELMEIVKRDFNSITAENDMKMKSVLRADTTFDWSKVDEYVAFANEHNYRLHGHALIWHRSTPDYIKAMEGDTAALKTFTQNYVKTYVSKYKEDVASWDVVNEPVLDDTGDYRPNTWYTTYGKDYLPMVYEMAHNADPDAKLFINDYNIERDTAKLNGLLRIVDDLQKSGAPIHGIGMQMHLQMDVPKEIIAHSIKKCVETGLLIHLSEVDIIFNQHGDEPGGGIQIYNELTDEMMQEQAEKYKMLAELYNQLVPPRQQYGITVWDFADSETWVRGFFDITDWPCLYDDSLNRKPAYFGFLDGIRSKK